MVDCTQIIEFVEYKTNNVRVVGWSPAMGTGRCGPPIHPVAKWIPGIWIRVISLLFNPFAPTMAAIDATLSGVWMV